MNFRVFSVFSGFMKNRKSCTSICRTTKKPGELTTAAETTVCTRMAGPAQHVSVVGYPGSGVMGSGAVGSGVPVVHLRVVSDSGLTVGLQWCYSG